MFSNTTRYFHDGFQRWFKRQNQIPQKKKRTWAQSATSNAVNGNIKVLDAHHLQAPRMEVVSFRAGRLPAGRIEQLPLHQNAVGQYTRLFSVSARTNH